jgi:hypothetical protein
MHGQKLVPNMLYVFSKEVYCLFRMEKFLTTHQARDLLTFKGIWFSGSPKPLPNLTTCKVKK